MKRPRLTVRRMLFAAVLLLLLAGISAPYFHADRFHSRIRDALESSLRREVEIESTRFNLFRGPGFSLRKVVIHEDPAFGIEPFAYVASIEARLRMWSLLGGKLEFSSLRLVNPSVNLVKGRARGWNFQPLVAQAARAELPEIRLRGGRINFKFEDTKSAVYLTDADLDVDPPSAPGKDFALRFAGEPARTDRTGSGLGRISGRGRWRPSPGALELSVALERSPLANLSILVRGYDVGVHGSISGEAKLSGTLPAIEVQGRIALEDLHRWDAMPPYAKGGTLPFRGRVDLLSQKLRLDTVPGEASALPVAIRLRAAEYLSSPRWALTAELRRTPLEPLVEIARHMGLPFAETLEMEGSADGVIGYAPGSGLRGTVAVSEARVRGPGSEPVGFRQARVVLEGTRLRLSQAHFETAHGEVARLEAEYLPEVQRFALRLTAAPLRLEALRSNAGPLLGIFPSPLPGRINGGQLEGALRYLRNGTAAEWSGEIRLTGAAIALPALAEPLSELSGRLRLDGERVNLWEVRAKAGTASLEGEYHYRPGARRPHQFVCRLTAADAAELERLLMPVLRRRGGLLSRALGLGRTPLPSWLRDLHAQGRLEIGALSVHGFPLEQMRGLVFWDATRLEVAGWECRLGEGLLFGRLLADLSGAEPLYEFAGAVKPVAWRAGTVGGDVLLRATGTGAALLSSLRLEGDFFARGVKILEDFSVDSATGCYQLAAERSQPRLLLRNIRAVSGQDVFTGEGGTIADGTLIVHLRAERGLVQVRLATRLFPRLEQVGFVTPR